MRWVWFNRWLASDQWPNNRLVRAQSALGEREGIDLWQMWALGRPSDQATHQQHTGLREKNTVSLVFQMMYILCGSRSWKMHMNFTWEHMLIIYVHMWEHVKRICFFWKWRLWLEICTHGFLSLLETYWAIQSHIKITCEINARLRQWFCFKNQIRHISGDWTQSWNSS